MAALNDDFSRDIAAIGGIDAVPTILDVVCRTTGMGFAAVARVTEKRWIACSVRDNIAFGLQPGGELEVESTICHEIRQHRLPVVINHVSEDPTYFGHHTPAQYGLQSYISMPIIRADGSFFGTLCAIDPRPAKLDTPEIVGMFRLFAELIAFHLDSIDKIAEGEASLRSERETSALRDQFIAILGHDLRNPVAAISGGLGLLRRETLSARGQSVTDLLQATVQRMSGLIDNVLDFARGRLGGGMELTQRRPEPMKPILEQVVEELLAGHPEAIIRTDLDLTAEVVCERSRIAQLFSNLLGNALNHGAPGKPIIVRASTGHAFELSVVNAGEPIPPQAMERLFEPFSRGEAQSTRQGLGLGLYIAVQIARAHGGDITVSSDEEETRFTFRMPLRPAGF